MCIELMFGQDCLMGHQQPHQQQEEAQQQVQKLPMQMTENNFAVGPNSMKTLNVSPVTLQQRVPEDAKKIEEDVLVTIPMSKLQNILCQPGASTNQISGNVENAGSMSSGNGQRKRRQDQMTPVTYQFSGSGFPEPVFTVPSPMTVSPIYVDQKHVPMNTSDDVIMSCKNPCQVSRPSPQSTPPPVVMDTDSRASHNSRKKYSSKSGRVTPTGKRSRPQTPTSDSESDGGYREREPISWMGGRVTPVETKPNIRLEDLEDEDKYNKRKRSTSGGDGARRKDPMKQMLEQLQQSIPHIGNPDEEKVSHAGLLVEGSDYIRSLKRENNTTLGNVEHLKLKIDQLHAEIEAFQDQLPEHGSTSIHKILSKRGKSIPDMFADHVRQKTQSDWRYWVFTSIMGHFVHSFAQEVSNISPEEMEKTSIDWLQEKMSMTPLRKDAYRKLAKLSSKTSIMEDPSKLPEEARSFVALEDTNLRQEQKKEFE